MLGNGYRLAVFCWSDDEETEAQRQLSNAVDELADTENVPDHYTFCKRFGPLQELIKNMSLGPKF